MSFADELISILNQYTDEIVEDVDKIGKEVAKGTAVKVAELAPEKSGSYKKSIRAKKSKNQHIVHSKEHYQLTHLLEKGYATRNGGRTKAIPHWKVAEEYGKSEYIKRVEERIKRGS